jgi:hypothetical protein
MNEASGQPQIKLIDDRNAGMPPGLCGRPRPWLFIAGAATGRPFGDALDAGLFHLPNFRAAEGQRCLVAMPRPE